MFPLYKKVLEIVKEESYLTVSGSRVRIDSPVIKTIISDEKQLPLLGKLFIKTPCSKCDEMVLKTYQKGLCKNCVTNTFAKWNFFGMINKVRGYSNGI